MGQNVRGVVFEANPNAVDELLGSAEAETAIGEITHMAYAEVQRASPEGRTKAFKRGLTAGAVTENGRAVGYIATDSSFWHFIEYGTARNPAYRPFARGMEAAGLKYEPLGPN